MPDNDPVIKISASASKQKSDIDNGADGKPADAALDAEKLSKALQTFNKTLKDNGSSLQIGRGEIGGALKTMLTADIREILSMDYEGNEQVLHLTFDSEESAKNAEKEKSGNKRAFSGLLKGGLKIGERLARGDGINSRDVNTVADAADNAKTLLTKQYKSGEVIEKLEVTPENIDKLTKVLEEATAAVKVIVDNKLDVDLGSTALKKIKTGLSGRQ